MRQVGQVTAGNVKRAKRLLHQWLKEHESHATTIDGIPPFSGWAYWTYSSRPFLSVYVNAFGRYMGVLGFHIYDDGEVLLVSREYHG